MIAIFSFSTLFASFDTERLRGKSFQTYDPDYVSISTVKDKYGYEYNVAYMQRDGNRVKAKYFAAKDYNGTSVPKRYDTWSKGKNVILCVSGTYMTDCYTHNNPKPVGLTIDNGVMVNNDIKKDDKDALVIVYATGGIACSNLSDGDLTLKGEGADENKKYDLRGSKWDLLDFIKWSENNEATVFQAHLLVYKNKIKVSSYNSDNTLRERRFLAVGTDEDGKLVHVIIDSPEYTSLYEGSKRVLEFLNSFKDMTVTFMINLDTGCQDVYYQYNYDGTLHAKIGGAYDINQTVNLLAYYFE